MCSSLKRSGKKERENKTGGSNSQGVTRSRSRSPPAAAPGRGRGREIPRYSQRVVVGLPALQLLEAVEALRHVGAVLAGAVHEARRRHLRAQGRPSAPARPPGPAPLPPPRPRAHPFGRAGAALGEGPVVEGGGADGLEVEPPPLGQHLPARHGPVQTAARAGQGGSGAGPPASRSPQGARAARRKETFSLWQRIRAQGNTRDLLPR